MNDTRLAARPTACVGVDEVADLSMTPREIVAIRPASRSPRGLRRNEGRVANGVSDLLQEVLGEAGRHARAAVGESALPLNAPVEVEFVFAVK